MYKITWDKETGGVLLHSRIVDGTLGTSPRPVFWEELDLLKLNKLGWKYPHTEEPLLWAVNKQYWYQGELMFEAKGANIYEPATIIFQPGKEKVELKPVDVKKMLERNAEFMFLLESEAIEFIRETFTQYAGAKRSVTEVKANQLDYEALAKRMEAKIKKKMAIVREDCDSFEIMPLDTAEEQGKKVFHTTKIDKFIASFSGGKDSQVVLDLCTRAIPSTEFEVIYSDTGYELPPSLELYQQVQAHYHQHFPNLKFSLTRNHESVLNYWDRIGTPSDTHRWCCSIMKTAPLYRSLKVEGTNKQAKVLTFDGVRAEESVRRGGYGRIGKGKHTSIYNAHPIINWNTIEIFLYLFANNFPINQAYRVGKARVGCLICPFSTAWDDMIASQIYPKELKPFTDRLVSWAKIAKIGKIDDFLKERNWKIKAVGDTHLLKSKVSFSDKNGGFTAVVENSRNSIYNWLHALCDYTLIREKEKDKGTLKFKEKLYDFTVIYKKESNFIFSIEHINDHKLMYLLRRVIYKSIYCVNCEVCEVDCPTGALSILPYTQIDKSKCVHCHKCLESHDKGCIAADCVRMIKNMNNNMNTKIQGYKTFGMRQEWLDEFLSDPEHFWIDNSLGTAQVDGFKAWLKDAEITDAKNNLTQLGEFMQQNKDDELYLIWEVIVTNLCYNSFIFRWFSNNVKLGQEYDKKILEALIDEQGYGNSGKTVANAVAAFIQTCDYSPVGDILNYGVAEDGKRVRTYYSDATKAGVAYNLYRYAEKRNVSSLRVSDFYTDECENGVLKALGLTEQTFVSILKSLNSLENRVLIAELNTGLDNITLREDLNALSCLKALVVP